MRPTLSLVICCLLLVTPATATTTTGLPPSPATGEIVAVSPNPVADGDAGEYVLLSLSRPGNWSITDGEATVTLPANVTGRVVLTAAPDRLPHRLRLQNVTLVRAPAIALANAGEHLTLRWEDRVVHRVAYGNAPEGERWLPTTGDWRPTGLHYRPVAQFGPTNATLFVLPDAPDVPIETLRSADGRLLLAGYTLTSARVADELVAAQRRGVDVRVLLEAEPVGSFPRREARLLDRLVEAGVDVRLLAGPHERFAYHHPKYAVVDDTALVLTENWKPAGVGGRSSRGWGVRVDSPAVADELAGLFTEDAAARDAVPWRRYRRGRSFESVPAATGDYPARFAPAEVRVTSVRVLTTPGNAEPAMVRLVENATTRIDVIQPTVGRESALLRACLRAARRGVEVRVLLSGAWYVAPENERLVRWLTGWADRTGAPLSARIAEPRGRFEKVHAKGLLVDDEVAVVGSLNWNRQAAAENREVLLAIAGADAVAYYRRVFAADWRGGGTAVPVGLLAGVIAAAAIALAAARRVEFTDERGW